MTNGQKGSNIELISDAETKYFNLLMSFNQDTAVKRAKEDLASRIDVQEADIKTISVAEREFPDMSLGAPADGELSAQMISSGWVITLNADNNDYEYRADKYQLRLVNFKQTNHVVVS